MSAFVERSRETIVGLDEPHWDTPTAAEAADVATANSLAWRRKYSFLGGGEGTQGARYLHTLPQVCALRTAVVLVKRGVDPKDACALAGIIQFSFGALMRGKPMSPLVAIPDSKAAGLSDLTFLSRADPLSMLMERTGGAAIVLDLEKIIDDVLTALGLTVRKDNGDEIGIRAQRVRPKNAQGRAS